MPNISQMNIGIGTNLGALEQGLSRASKKISSFSAGVEKRLGSISTGRLEKGLSNISAKGVPAADKLASSMGNLKSPVRGSTSAVINFNRVIQDAPFGILGVANNLEPLANSFNQLKSQTGSATGALTTLLKSAFTGPGALITVVSVASSALIVLQRRFRGTKKEAEELNDTMSTLNKSWERTIELQDQFGAFDEDDFGIAKAQAQIREITEDLQHQRGILKEINQLSDRRRQLQIKLGKEGLTDQESEELALIESQLGRLGDQEQVQLRINKLEEKRQRISEELVNTASALADSDTKQAQQSQKTNEQKERQLQFEKDIAEARREALQMDRPDPPSLGLEELEFEDISIPDKFFPPGSLGALQNRLKSLKQSLQVATNPQDIASLQQKIESTQGSISEFGSEATEAGQKSSAAMGMLADATGGVIGNLIKGKKEALSFGNILSSVLPAIATLLFPGSGTGAKFARGLFGGIFHQGGTVPGALGQERLILAQGGETIRTPKQERALGKGSGGSRTINIPVYLNGRQIANATGEYEDKVNR